MNSRIKNKLINLPNNPGCYKFYDEKGRIIYIGKAKNIKKRVNSYFSNKELDTKTKVLVEKTRDIDWEITDSEIEALILESFLIKKHKPRYNIKIKDDKDFLYIKVDLNKKFPQPECIRKPSLKREKNIKVFGPFTDSKLLKSGLDSLRKIFLWRDCSDSKFRYYKNRGKPCLEYFIKNCNAPCKGYINDNDYQIGIRQLIKFLEGKKKGIIKDLEKEMRELSKEKKYEEAVIIRDKIKSLKHVEVSLRQSLGSTRELPGKVLRNIIPILNRELRYKLKHKKDFRIEFYDISNISGKEAVGSMVVWEGDGFKRSDYRKFTIRTIKGIDDFKMMSEVIERRLKNKEWKEPNLIILDGGKGQLGTVKKLFKRNNIFIPLLSLAKKEEEVFGIVDGRFKKVSVKKNSQEGYFIQRLRDEAHRFAITYHRNLRTKKVIKSRLDKIEGMGPKTRKKLLREFGSVDGIIGVKEELIAQVVGKKLARRIKESL